MIKKINGEIWKPLRFKGWQSMRNRYALSSHGRAASYKEVVLEDGKLLEGSLTSGYRTLNLHVNGNNGTIYLHREIAKLFKKKDSPKQKYVLHINYDKSDNSIKNLKWDEFLLNELEQAVLKELDQEDLEETYETLNNSETIFHCSGTNLD